MVNCWPVIDDLPVPSAPQVCGPWEGKVATHGSLSGFVITTPTEEHIPPYPREVDIIHTYTDGRWGSHEYSRQPQQYVEEEPQCP